MPAGRAQQRAQGRRARAASPGGDRDGPRRPRQDLAARLHPQDPRRPRRGGRHHPAHRRLSRRDAARHGHLPRHAGPRGVYRHARPRRQGDRHRDPGGGGRRRRDAADQGSHPPCQGRQRAAGGGGEQDRQAGSQPRPRQAGTGGRKRPAGRVRRRFARSSRCRPRPARASTTCSSKCCCRPRCWSSRRRRTPWPRASSSNPVSTRARVRWPPCWCSRARSSAATSCWPAPCMAACAPCSTRTARRSRRPGLRFRSRSRASPTCRWPATRPWPCPTSARRARSRCSARASSATSSWPSSRRPSWRTCSSRWARAR
jgi:hypothetical protein